jgi:hypothetical protein
VVHAKGAGANPRRRRPVRAQGNAPADGTPHTRNLLRSSSRRGHCRPPQRAPLLPESESKEAPSAKNPRLPKDELPPTAETHGSVSVALRSAGTVPMRLVRRAARTQARGRPESGEYPMRPWRFSPFRFPPGWGIPTWPHGVAAFVTSQGKSSLDEGDLERDPVMADATAITGKQGGPR